MKVLMTTDCIGGVWTYALELIHGLSVHGVQVALATMGGKLSDHQRDQLSQLDGMEVFESNYRLEWMPDPWHDVELAGNWLLEVREHVEPDIVHLNHFAHGHLDWQSPVLTVGHSCVCSWMQAVRGCEAGPEWDRYRFHVGRGLRASDLVVAPTHHMLAALKGHYGPFLH